MLNKLDALLDETSGISLFITRVKGTNEMRVILTVRPNKTSLKEKDSKIATFSPKILSGQADELELELTSEKIVSILRERVQTIKEVDAEVEKEKDAKAATKTATKTAAATPTSAPSKTARKAGATKTAPVAPSKVVLNDEEKTMQNRISNIRNLVVGKKRNEAHAELSKLVTDIRTGRAAGNSYNEEFIIGPIKELSEEIRKMPAEQAQLPL